MDSLKEITLWFAAGAELAAAIVIGLATIEAVLRALLAFWRGSVSDLQADPTHNAKEQIRLRLGRWLALGLEFLLAADILRTAVAPTWTEIGQLASIVVLRIVINYFLQRDIDRVMAREEGH
jgi:uncharacterized membrane protein